MTYFILGFLSACALILLTGTTPDQAKANLIKWWRVFWPSR
jgi:hypothetical protein